MYAIRSYYEDVDGRPVDQLGLHGARQLRGGTEFQRVAAQRQIGDQQGRVALRDAIDQDISYNFV